MLRGKLDDTAYEQELYLAEREGAFVQLTPLLYHALEQVDGKRSFAEIAQRLTEIMGRPYEPANAKRLLEKLVPLGLVVDGEGNIPPPPQGFSALRSPLALNLRMALISMATANAIARPFTLLFFPPVIALLVLASLAAHVWLYAMHGVAQGASQVLYNPGLTLALIGAFVIAAAFHELGHAAGLRYGGGNVRAMGVGLYLVYPVFYTDISASYAMGRGGRLRADLGGFYFNAIFQLAVIGLWTVTHQEFLLLLAMLVDVEVLYQCLPFVRMDGYWIFADLTGVPDFFTRMGAAIRRFFPGAKKDQLPPLKPWARVVFALYALIVAPILALLLTGAFRSFPSVLATAFDSGGKLLAGSGDAWAHGDAITAVADIAQLLLLALQALGLAMVIFVVSKRALTALWSWAQPSTGRRAFATVATIGAAALLLYAWLPPSAAVAGPSGGPAYSAVTNTSPITPTDRGTVADAIPAVAGLLPSSPGTQEPLAPSATPSAQSTVSATPSATTSPAGSAAPATVVPTATATATPAATPTPSATP